MKTIITNYVYPPIPTRNYDWEAYRADYNEGDLVGRGKTEKDAVRDLVRQEQEF